MSNAQCRQLPFRTFVIRHSLVIKYSSFVIGTLALLAGCTPSSKNSGANVTVEDPSYTEHIAPIVLNHCAYCHRPGETAPFPLLTYSDVKRRGRQIVEVTQSRYMPPWLPLHGIAAFKNERRLTTNQIQTLENWVNNGMRAGDDQFLPATPEWPDGWLLGKPDLVVSMPEAYTLAAEGDDVYRNFVVPIENETQRYVRAVEFDPGNRTIVHHAFMLLDSSQTARKLDRESEGVGFDGIHFPSEVASPEGHFLSWQPGKQPSSTGADMSWVLEKGTDIVLQLHLQPTGKPETIQSRVALYFSDSPPQKRPLKIWLGSYDIKVPANQPDYTLNDAYVLPTDVTLYGILPHAHYLAKEMEVVAMLPTGETMWLMWIRNWDFNWQGDYQYAEPVPLPKGTEIRMRYVYDNSTNNPANPFDPPREVGYGLQSTDEMGELWLQVLPSDEAGRQAIQNDYRMRGLDDAVAYNLYLLKRNPDDPDALVNLGRAKLYQARYVEAESALTRAINLNPDNIEARYFLGLLYRHRNQLQQAFDQFLETVKRDPDHAKGHGNLGILYLQHGDAENGEKHLKRALELNPDDAIAQRALADLATARNTNP